MEISDSKSLAASVSSLWQKHAGKCFGLGLLLIVLGGAYFLFRNDCEIIEPPPGGGIFRHPSTAVAIEDDSLFDRVSTKEVMNALFPESKLIICSGVHRHSLNEAHEATVVLFGHRCDRITAFNRADDAVLLVFPRSAPPTEGIFSVKVVVLSSSDPKKTNDQWKSWCGIRGIPCVQIVGESHTSAIKGLDIAWDLYVEKESMRRNKGPE